MKTVLIALVSALSLQSIAHASSSECYYINPTSHILIEGTPDRICLDSGVVNLHNQILHINSETQPTLFKNIKTDYFARRNEDGYRFRISITLHNQSAGMCDFHESSVLKIHGLTDNDGAVDITFLDVTIEQFQTPDNCHSKGARTVLTYSN